MSLSRVATRFVFGPWRELWYEQLVACAVGCLSIISREFKRDNAEIKETQILWDRQ